MRELDPDFALQTRLSLGSRGRYGWIAVLVFVLLWLSRAPSAQTARSLAVFASLCLYVALPYAAIHIRLLEARGHLDLHRLQGRAPAVALGWLLAGGAWWLFAAGSAFLVVPLLAGVMDGLKTAAILASSAGITAVLLSLPSRPSATWLSLLVVPALGGLLLTAAGSGSKLVTLASVTCGVIVTAAAAPRAIALLTREGAAGGTGFSRAWRLGTFARTRSPEFLRGLASTEKPKMAAIAVVVTPLLVLALIRAKAPDSRAPGYVALAYSQLVTMAFMLSSRLRTDRESGGLERIRVASQTPWRALAELTLGVATPLLVMAASAIVTMLALDPWTAIPVLIPWPATVVTLIALGLLDGIRSRYLGVCIAPALLFLTVLALDDNAQSWSLFLVAWIPAALAFASAEGLDGEALPPAIACTAIAGAAAWLGLQYQPDAAKSIAWGGGLLSLAAPFLMPARRHRSWTALALCTVTALIAASATASLAGTASWDAVLSGTLVASGFTVGWLASQLSSSRSSLVVRSIPLAVWWIVWRINPFKLVWWLQPLHSSKGMTVFVLMDVAYLIGLVAMILVLAVITARWRHELA